MSHHLDIEQNPNDLHGKTSDKISDRAVELKEKASELSDKASEKVSQLSDKAGELKDKASEKVSQLSDKAGELKDKASEKVSQLSDKAHEMASDLHEKTDRSLHSLGQKMTRAADTARAKGLAGMADRLESGGHFLSENGVNELSNKATGLIRKHPVESMVIGLGIGILLGSLLSARRERS